ncbi:Rz-like spanin [Providencia phage Kokobel1]|uniref:I-spanin n=1 Tax=Providencia phage Kokobel1 TaxID=2783540 RepID=A0A873WND0_9CAUD|nr:Rz-like spanin [Providencia phage Kokobel1]QPB11435.1 hypothetical protein [Providencia phage Kokobel1]
MGFWAKVKAVALGVAAFFVLMFLTWRKGKQDGKQEQVVEDIIDAHVEQEKVIEVKNDVDSGINSLPSGGSNKRLRNGWMRKDGE